MIVKVNLDNMEIATERNTIKCATVNEFKDNVARIIKGKAEKKVVPITKWVGENTTITRDEEHTVYTKYANLEEIQFITNKAYYKKFIYDGKMTNYSTLGTFSWTASQLFGLCLSNKIYATYTDGIKDPVKIDGDLLDKIQDIRDYESIDKDNHNNIYRLVSAITASGSSDLLNLYMKCLLKDAEKPYLDIERFTFELQTYIRNSGYDVDMSSETTIEGKLNYKFYDGAVNVEGSKNATTKYKKYVPIAIDLVNMYLNVCYYQSIGLEPELETQRRATIGLANSWRFTDDDELDKFIEKEMHSGDIEDYDEATHLYNATVEMLLN